MTRFQSVFSIFGLGALIFVGLLLLPFSRAEGSMVNLDTEFELPTEVKPDNWKLMGAYRVRRSEITQEWVPILWCDLEEAYSRSRTEKESEFGPSQRLRFVFNLDCQSTGNLTAPILSGEKPLVLRVFQTASDRNDYFPRIKGFENWDLENFGEDHPHYEYELVDGHWVHVDRDENPNEENLKKDKSAFFIEHESVSAIGEDKFPYNYPCGRHPLFVYRDQMEVEKIKKSLFKRSKEFLNTREDPKYRISFELECDPFNQTLNIPTKDQSS